MPSQYPVPSKQAAALVRGWTVGSSHPCTYFGEPSELLKKASDRILTALGGCSTHSRITLEVDGACLDLTTISDALLTPLGNAKPELRYTGYIAVDERFHLFEFSLTKLPSLIGNLAYLRSSPLAGTSYHLSSVGWREGGPKV